MNDWSSTHYCSGSESGWTMYLDQSYTSDHHFCGSGGDGGVGENYKAKEAKARTEQEDEEEDLSMVSDASSGPPHYIEDNEELFYTNGYSSYAFSASESAINCNKEEIKKGKKGKQNGRNQQHSYLDDTASSPVYGYSKPSKINVAISNKALEENPVDFSQGFSATHFKRKSALRKHLGFYRSEKSAPEE
ncbi:protein SOB FIVE-LIKE 6-like [Benincasa hispida]|uniref:protein SOB FIVE-LIKE 6-like n=1 Tax=Benincasa hispida TaxID=102211 RepID=UPI0018FF1818|nr:protein SOB FIVE-LIKE 6-like [Benincasa hispida]